MIEHPHGIVEQRVQEAFYQDKGIDSGEKLWEKFKEIWKEVTTPEAVQKDIASLRKTWQATVMAGGGPLKKRKDLT